MFLISELFIQMDNFDVIVFNEVLYYLTLEDVEVEFNRYVSIYCLVV